MATKLTKSGGATGGADVSASGPMRLERTRRFRTNASRAWRRAQPARCLFRPPLDRTRCRNRRPMPRLTTGRRCRHYRCVDVPEVEGQVRRCALEFFGDNAKQRRPLIATELAADADNVVASGESLDVHSGRLGALAMSIATVNYVAPPAGIGGLSRRWATPSIAVCTARQAAIHRSVHVQTHRHPRRRSTPVAR